MEFGHYIGTLIGLKNQKAIKMVNICEALGVRNSFLSIKIGKKITDTSDIV